MKQTHQCPKCGSRDIIADAKAVDRGHANAESELSVVTFSHPEAFVFKGKHRATLSAWVCAGCGYVEFYADDAAKLKPGAA